MKVLILGAGNVLLTDEGFGVHFIRHLQQRYVFPDNVELFDAGTMGIMSIHKIEEADLVFILDAVVSTAEPGSVFRYNREEFMLNKVPVKLSPHQVGVQEMLLVSEMRGHCPAEVYLIGAVPASTEPGSDLSEILAGKLPEIADKLIEELRGRGIAAANS